MHHLAVGFKVREAVLVNFDFMHSVSQHHIIKIHADNAYKPIFVIQRHHIRNHQYIVVQIMIRLHPDGFPRFVSLPEPSHMLGIVFIVKRQICWLQSDVFIAAVHLAVKQARLIIRDLRCKPQIICNGAVCMRCHISKHSISIFCDFVLPVTVCNAATGLNQSKHIALDDSYRLFHITENAVKLCRFLFAGGIYEGFRLDLDKTVHLIDAQSTNENSNGQHSGNDCY